MGNMVTATCPTCKTTHSFERHIDDAAQERKGPDGMRVWCPNGHNWYYLEGQSEAEKLRRERDRLKQRLAEKDDMIDWERRKKEQAERSASAYKGQVTKIKNRVGKGVCPCCNRTFQNVHKHMASQHPDYSDEGPDKPDLKVVGGSSP